MAPNSVGGERLGFIDKKRERERSEKERKQVQPASVFRLSLTGPAALFL